MIWRVKVYKPLHSVLVYYCSLTCFSHWKVIALSTRSDYRRWHLYNQPQDLVLRKNSACKRLCASPSNYAVVTNFRKHKLPIISEEDWGFFTSGTERECFSSGFLYGFHRIVQIRNKLFLVISHNFFSLI